LKQIHTRGADDHSQLTAITDSNPPPAHLGFFHFKTPPGDINVLARGVRARIETGASLQPIPDFPDSLHGKLLHCPLQASAVRVTTPSWSQGKQETPAAVLVFCVLIAVAWRISPDAFLFAFVPVSVA
jgi:hypothetical protein